MDKGYWMPKGGGHLTDGETVFSNSSRIETKRSHQWLSDAADHEVFPNKKQAVHVPVSKPASGVPIASLAWENASPLQSVPNQFIDRLFGSNTTGSADLSGRNLFQVDAENSNMRRKVMDDQFGGDPSVGLSMSYPLGDTETCVSYGGIRKVKVNQVKDSENGLQAAMEHNFAMSLDRTYNRETETAFMSMRQAFGREGENVTMMSHSQNRVEASIKPLNYSFTKGDDNTVTLAHPFSKGDSNTISFGGYQDESYIDALARPISSYDLLCHQSSLPIAETLGGKELDASNATAVVSTSQMPKPKPDSVPKNKSETKPARKEAPNSFPSNVRSLLATGMLDGVPVRYVSVSREELRGTIKGSGYLCGCQTCNYSKALNAYEFERHAGCKTKHPNNHIYFESGKTIYQIVQELRSTPENLLFDAVLNVTGSQINQKAFRIWKESFQAATRELQRIYGKEEFNI
ncbi:hypothetical protein ACH5RR_020828 [Cinchona calisaya]|uniref:Tify domain-containing protein n=1 Tax=Cinchona calisaya TaxID=153742 RepID=A0ABD2ZGK5_9GENT